MYQKVLTDPARYAKFIKERTGENNPNWRGDMVGYRPLHSWVERRLGIPRECVKCGDLSAKRYDWANVSGEYKRDLKDWMRLCRGCHLKNDFTEGKRKKLVEVSKHRYRDEKGRFIN